MNFFFEEVQKVKIAIYDIDNITPELSDDDFLGQIETTLGQVSTSVSCLNHMEFSSEKSCNLKFKFHSRGF